MRCAVGGVLSACAVVFLLGALAPEKMVLGNGGATGRYLFLPARDNLWVVDQTKGALVFFKFPDNQDRPIQRSRTFTLDRTRFPAERTTFFTSMRNLTSLLWIANVDTGEVMVLRYRRDGTFDTEFQLMAGQQFQ
jgi:hypothetical protein